MTNATTIRSVPVDDGLASRTPAELEADIEAIRARLAGTVDAIADRVRPANIARRAIGSAKAQVVDGSGSLRIDRVALLTFGVAGVLGLLIWRRTR